VPGVTAYDLAEFVGPSPDHRLRRSLELVTAFARAYTRGRGFDDEGRPEPDIAAAIVTAAARLTSNPTGVITETMGDYSVRYGAFQGFNLVELAVLNAYRRRAA
jgi:hypothetical protein